MRLEGVQPPPPPLGWEIRIWSGCTAGLGPVQWGRGHSSKSNATPSAP